MARSILSTGLILTVVLGSGLVAVAIPPPPEPVFIWEDPKTGECLTGAATVRIGRGVFWINNTDRTVRIRQREGYWRFRIPDDGSRSRKMHSAGTFFESCDGGDHGPDVRVKIKAPSRSSEANFRVTWADSSASSSNRYAVRFKVGNSGNYERWKSRTTARSDIFHGRHDRTYFLQAKSIRNGEGTEWSPKKKVVVS